MCSYNSINGIPSCASKKMQTEMLRGNWSFPGYVVGDSDTVQVLSRHAYIYIRKGYMLPTQRLYMLARATAIYVGPRNGCIHDSY
jgi:hypothetical protein